MDDADPRFESRETWGTHIFNNAELEGRPALAGRGSCHSHGVSACRIIQA